MLFRSDFTVLGYASDHVGNESRICYGTTEFALESSVKRILEPQEPVFKCGESGILTFTTWGYADRVEVIFPECMTALDPTLNKVYDYTESQGYRKTEELEFMVPLYTPENQTQEITVRAYKGDKRLEDHPTISVIGVSGNGEYDTDTLLAWEKINEYKEAGTILPVTISGIVNKGVIALVEGVRGFIPVSRLDINHVEDTLDWLGRDIRVRVIEADMERNKLVLSAREILREESEAARKAQREMAVSKIEVGSVVEGKVESIQPYGAFVDLGNNVTGLVHISQISMNHIKSPKEALEVGQIVKAKVIKNDGGKISLSIKDLLEEKRIQEEEEIKNNMQEVESIGTSLGSLLSGLKLD